MQQFLPEKLARKKKQETPIALNAIRRKISFFLPAITICMGAGQAYIENPNHSINR
jgi:hypothetical protein